MRLLSNSVHLLTNRFKRIDLSEDCSLFIKEESKVYNVDHEVESMSLKELGRRLSEKMDEFILEKEEKFFLKIVRPVTFRICGRVTVRIHPQLSPSILASQSFGENKGVLVIGENENVCENALGNFAAEVKHSHDLPRFLRETKRLPGILGVVGVVGRVVGSWGKGKMDVI
ncbi:hypothetical protein [Thermotoga sp. KOL6]|uniref:hypothetical protein n=1 Tax=Thermotoga sp. KOL6 TaxID=126741 RepID=UPI000C763814|nr:hypothetical protein [Thermotoga sp. KOL6]PLV59479.1 hypothetical protein AS005_06990 [Thermotoga sp. KOL6]